MEPGPGRIQIDLSKRQQQLLDAFLILATIAARVHRAGLPGQRLQGLQRHHHPVLPGLAAVVRAAAADQRRGAPDPGRAARGRGGRRLQRASSSWSSRCSSRWRRSLAQLDRRVHPDLPGVARPSSGASSRAIAGAAGRTRLHGRAREPGADHHRRTSTAMPGSWPGRSSSWRSRASGWSGNLLILVILSLYIAIDRERDPGVPLPPRAARTTLGEARLLRVRVGRSFGGFLRGQVVMGVVYGLVAAVANIVLGPAVRRGDRRRRRACCT